jgi:O-methyltransferase
MNSIDRIKTTLLEKLYSILAVAVSYKKGVILIYDDAYRKGVMDLIYEIRAEREMLLSNVEAYSVYMGAKRSGKLEGDLAEVGVYKGASAKLICEAKEDRPLHLFDTFEGIPNVDKIDVSNFYKGQYANSLDDVRTYLSAYSNIYFYKGIFPSTSKPTENKKFSFVHLDVDTYNSTLECLKFFYPRMSKGGIIISHDYINKEGVKSAFDGFFADKLEAIIELSGSQCLVVKV